MRFSYFFKLFWMIVFRLKALLNTDNCEFDLIIKASQTLQEVDDTFLSYAFGSNIIEKKWRGECAAKHDPRCFFNYSSVKVRSLMRGLSPAVLRVGGTAADYLIFRDDISLVNTPEAEKKTKKNFTMSRVDVNKLCALTKDTNTRLLFDLNVLLRRHGNWDPKNAKLLWNYIIKIKCNDRVDFELGNEPNALKHSSGTEISPEQIADDFANLRHLLRNESSFYLKFFKQSRLVGPDITSPRKKHDGVELKYSPTKYLLRYLKTLGIIAPDKITFHHYYFDGRTASVSDFINAETFDQLAGVIRQIKEVLRTSGTDRPLWLGETASAYGGGARGLSDTYVSGFLWLDKLGTAAKYGVKTVIRQTLYEGSYALLDGYTNPNPDYWLSALFKKLVGNQVLEVQMTPSTNKLRIYAHCTSKRSIYKTKKVIIYVINLFKTRVTIKFKDSRIDQYLLTPNGPNKNLTSREILLNGKQLKIKHKRLPSFEPMKLTSRNTLQIPALSYGFFVIVDPPSGLC